VVVLTVASEQEEDNLLILEPAIEQRGLDISADPVGYGFAKESIFISPGLAGDVSFVNTQASEGARDLQMNANGFVGFDYTDLVILGNGGIGFTFRNHLSATDTEALPIDEAIFPLNHRDEFPSWDSSGVQASSTIQLKVAAEATPQVKAAFQEILNTIQFF
jgi:hypothetical protein